MKCASLVLVHGGSRCCLRPAIASGSFCQAHSEGRHLLSKACRKCGAVEAMAAHRNRCSDCLDMCWERHYLREQSRHGWNPYGSGVNARIAAGLKLMMELAYG